MSNVVWYFSDNYITDWRASSFLLDLGIPSSHALTKELINIPGQATPRGFPRLTPDQIVRMASKGAEIHNHWSTHVRAQDLTAEELVWQFDDSSAYWEELLGPDCTALKVAAIPYYGTEETKQLAMSDEYSWQPYKWVLSNHFRPAEACHLPEGYDYKWVTPWKDNIEAELLAAADKPDQVLLIGYHMIVANPKKPNHMRWDDFVGYVNLILELGLNTTTILQLAEEG